MLTGSDSFNKRTRVKSLVESPCSRTFSHTSSSLFPRVSPGYASAPDILSGSSSRAFSDSKKKQFLPFKPDTEVGPPRVCVWQYLTQKDLTKLKDMDFNKKDTFTYFEEMFPDEVAGNGKTTTFELLYEVLRYCRVHNMTDQKTSAIFSMYYITHQYFCASLWRTSEEVYNYFKECILLHTILESMYVGVMHLLSGDLQGTVRSATRYTTAHGVFPISVCVESSPLVDSMRVEHPPKSAEILEPSDCRSALIHFCKVYLRHLPLVHITSLPNYNLLLMWNIKPVEEMPQSTSEISEVEISSHMNKDFASKLSKGNRKRGSKS